MIHKLLLTLRIYENVINESINTLFIRFMKKAGAFVTQKYITVYSYNPYLVINVVFEMSEGQILS
jgi:hypothetical protein